MAAWSCCNSYNEHAPDCPGVFLDDSLERIQSLESELKRKDEALKIAINVFEKMMEASISYRIMPFVAKQALAKIKEVLG